MESTNRDIRDLIIPLDRYPHLNENQTMQEAIQTFMAYRDERHERLLFTVLLVVNDQNQLVSKLSMLDILHGLAPSLLEATRAGKFEGKGEIFPNLAYLYEDSTFATCGDNQYKPIKPLLQPIDFFLPADTIILKALIMMTHQNNFNVPVTDNGDIIGVLRLEEVFNAMCNTYCAI